MPCRTLHRCGTWDSLMQRPWVYAGGGPMRWAWNSRAAWTFVFHTFLLSSWNPSVKENINLSQSSPYFRSSIRSIPNFCPTKSSHVCHGTRPQAVEALSWAELAEVALAYASLRLYSQSLFGAGAHFWWCGRICQERGEHCLKLHSLVFWLLFFFCEDPARCWGVGQVRQVINVDGWISMSWCSCWWNPLDSPNRPWCAAAWGKNPGSRRCGSILQGSLLGLRFVKIMVDQNVYDSKPQLFPGKSKSAGNAGNHHSFFNGFTKLISPAKSVDFPNQSSMMTSRIRHRLAGSSSLIPYEDFEMLSDGEIVGQGHFPCEQWASWSNTSKLSWNRIWNFSKQRP